MKRLADMEQLRKRVFPNQLLPNSSWKPVPKIFKIMPSHTDDDGQ
jgi:hypothetical protein